MIKRAPILLIQAYQKTLGPMLPVLLGPGCGCRFAPTCSQYAIEALSTHGVIAGSYLAARRVLRCHPFHPGGVDLVPAVSPNPKRLERSATQSFDPVGLDRGDQLGIETPVLLKL